MVLVSVSLALTSIAALAQQVQIQPVEAMPLPTIIDGNTPFVWRDGNIQMFSSTGVPMVSTASSLLGWWESENVQYNGPNRPIWFESAWVDEDGTILAWYHHEPEGVCGTKGGLTAPKIGAAVSYDGGFTMEDLGIVLEAGDPVDCSAKNGFFAGGHGDFSVILDHYTGYFYFMFTNYAGPLERQGVATARFAFQDRYQPAGAVWKYFEGDWTEPGVKGKVTPVFPAMQAWQRADADSWWGPAVHWNTYLNRYVVFLNRACCAPGWPQEGIYMASTLDISRPLTWSWPQKIMSKSEIGSSPGYYPQILGFGPGETDSIAGQVVRLFIQGVSKWEITFE
ncbi:MAG: hypothetical protein HY820_23795 [Acidobacteria bacterium]|nr:hypothetical protein [Acidobacteriota bacterium]